MTDAPRERILAAVEARLSAITGVAGLKVERERARGEADPITDENLPLLVLFDAGQSQIPEGEWFVGEYGYTLAVQIEGVVSGAPPEAAADGLRARALLELKVADALMTTPLVIGTTHLQVRMADEQQPERVDLTFAPQGICGFTVTYAIDYAVSDTNLFAFA